MPHCPECEATIAQPDDIEFADVDNELNLVSFESPKRFYAAACADCGHTLGAGVAGAGRDS